ncbi:S10 family peptidase [Microlunatus soli]|uniref:Carboxypeptidase C (Cathepsin A) n=1 Tax=Microlunatus soli TaxID=630515 RepID=A0A1H1SHY3_9ACTN|nr:peptidase S10 [Microlunatus soli]SDS47428.1 Carboxypeptidase C (cathepsin A) [Microlunatus soli]
MSTQRGADPASSQTPADDRTERREAPDSTDRAGAADPTDHLISTDHTLTGPDWAMEYQAITGTMVVGEETVEEEKFAGVKPKAEVFVTSYLAKDAGTDRPVVFAFNGGPGSSSVWLHLGIFGPRRVLSGDVDDPQPAPYGLVDNPESLLRYADLVFIDPMTTGYTRAVVGGSPTEYHGYTRDRDLVGEVIRIWLGRHQRWLSPKFLAGESYGTTRAASLAGHLVARHGIALNGIILISAVLDFATIRFTRGNDLPYLHYLPTYAATAAYHQGLGTDEVEQRIERARDFAATTYASSLALGSRLSEEDQQALAEDMSELIGLDAGYIRRARFRIEHRRFFAELLRDRGLDTGRLDTRFTMAPADLNNEVQEVDPSHMFIFFPYTAAFNAYVRGELGFTSDLAYEILSGRVQPWSYREFEGRGVTATEELSAALRANPDMGVYVGFGYYDGATPFSASEYVLDHLDVPTEITDRVVRRYYPAGHMTYVHEESRIAQSRDIADFVIANVPGSVQR